MRQGGNGSGTPGRRAGPAGACLGIAALLFLGPARAVAAEERTLECRVVTVTVDGVYVDGGSEAGLAAGSPGFVERDGKVVALVEVAEVTRSSAFLQVSSRLDGDGPHPGDRVFLRGEARERVEPDPRPPPSPTLRQGEGDEEPFVPLLAPPAVAAASRAESIFHGRAWARQLLQVDPQSLLDYAITRTGTSGSVERLGGTPWALEWAGEVSYRDGQALRFTDDYQDVRFDLTRLSAYRRFEDGSFLRLGRFLPHELPAVGYLDGGQGELQLNDHLRLGALLGLKPDRFDLDFSLEEPAVVAYATVEAGEREALYTSGTLGVLGSLYRGDPDRLALLLDQRAGLGRYLTLYSSMEVDMDAGGAETRSGPGLTRWNLYALSPVTSFLTLRAGLDRYQVPDIAAERAALGLPDGAPLDRIFDRGYWRTWAGSSLGLPFRLRLDDEISFTEAERDDYSLRWRLSLSRIGLPGFPTAQLSVTVYNLESSTLEGYGGRIGGYFPFLDGRLALVPAAGFRYLESDPAGETFDITDVSIEADWMLSSSWSVYVRLSHTFGTSVAATFLDMGVTFRW